MASTHMWLIMPGDHEALHVGLIAACPAAAVPRKELGKCFWTTVSPSRGATKGWNSTPGVPGMKKPGPWRSGQVLDVEHRPALFPKPAQGPAGAWPAAASEPDQFHGPAGEIVLLDVYKHQGGIHSHAPPRVRAHRSGIRHTNTRGALPGVADLVLLVGGERPPRCRDRRDARSPCRTPRPGPSGRTSRAPRRGNAWGCARPGRSRTPRMQKFGRAVGLADEHPPGHALGHLAVEMGGLRWKGTS